MNVRSIKREREGLRLAVSKVPKFRLKGTKHEAQLPWDGPANEIARFTAQFY